ncbi:hypothetical protein [Pseudomonas paraveronii]|uniref:hypothetical protein n=1 Tax=Pseudomonas paraveronii TaxID=3040598 RepID=UPI002AB0B330|nr:hypothetical protein [Pseudomonas sp. FLM 11]
MARQEIILGTPPTGLGGDTPRVASSKINAMTLELYQGIGTPAAPLPLERGGTGGKTQAAAQAALGLVPVGATNDVNPGRLMIVGYGGVGGQLQNRSNTPDAALTLMSGASFSYGGQGGSYPTGATDGALISLSYETTGSFVYQMLGDWRTGNLYRRGRAGGVSGTWAKIYDDVNAFVDPASGGLMSRTTVSGFDIFKYANGKIELIGPIPTSATIAANSNGYLDVTIPNVLDARYFATVSASPAPSMTWDVGGAMGILTSATTVRVLLRNGATAQTFTGAIQVSGRWK